jgi:protein-disulfide isomerase
MPRKSRNSPRPRPTANNLRRNILISAGVAGAVIVIILIAAAGPSAPPSAFQGGVAFPAREMGTASAKVVVEEFADFQCPICAVFNSSAEARLREEYIKTGKIRFIFHNFPVVDSHVANGNESHLAALAALCAADQNSFWEYHDLLFQNQSGENQGTFSTPRLDTFAVQLHLDSVTFDQCLINETHLDILDGDIQLGQHYGVNGTPSFIVNGVRVDGPYSADFPWLFVAIDKALAKAGG